MECICLAHFDSPDHFFDSPDSLGATWVLQLVLAVLEGFADGVQLLIARRVVPIQRNGYIQVCPAFEENYLDRPAIVCYSSRPQQLARGCMSFALFPSIGSNIHYMICEVWIERAI